MTRPEAQALLCRRYRLSASDSAATVAAMWPKSSPIDATELRRHTDATLQTHLDDLEELGS